MDMTVQISRSAWAAIHRSVAASPLEVCGLLLGRNGFVEEARACRNVHPAPASHFELDPAMLFAVLRAARAGGPQVIGHYHSHPSGDVMPSITDAAAATADGAVWLIVAGREARAWRAVRDGAVHGRFDPLPLVVAR